MYVLWENPGDGGPVIHSDAPLVADGTSGRPRGEEVAAHRMSVRTTGKARSREDRRRVEAAGESDGRIRAMRVGNGRHPDPAEQRRASVESDFRRETCP
jgi:hypothetical protein